MGFIITIFARYDRKNRVEYLSSYNKAMAIFKTKLFLNVN